MIKDPYFCVDVISATPNPQKTVYAAAHQDYSEEFVVNELFGPKQKCEGLTVFLNQCNEVWHDPFSKTAEKLLDETEAGKRVVERVLKFRHYGPIEHPQIVFNVGWFPHSLMQQFRTHRTGISFDCQSFRYSGKRIYAVAMEERDVEEVFYLRPVGPYSDRQGKKYDYTEAERSADIEYCREAAFRYKDKIDKGFSEEHARSLIPFDTRQHFVVSMNLRTCFHILELRMLKDAQLEIQTMCAMMLPYLETWAPEIVGYFIEKRLGKNNTSP
jgi:thymidylate synthase (FAD)